MGVVFGGASRFSAELAVLEAGNRLLAGLAAHRLATILSIKVVIFGANTSPIVMFGASA